MKLLIFLIIFLLSSPVGAATYYMRADGTNADPDCSEASACCAGAMDISDHDAASFSAGDIINVCDSGGIYNDQVDIPSSGSSGSPITYQAAMGDSPVFDGYVTYTFWGEQDTNIWSSSTGSPSASWNASAIYEDNVRLVSITWSTDLATTKAKMYAGTWTHDGVTPQGNKYWLWCTDDAAPSTHTIHVDKIDWPFYMDNKDNITIDGMTIRKAKFSGIYAKNGSDNVIIKNCTSIQGYMGGFNTQSVNTLFLNNTVYGTGHVGINYSGGTSAIMRGNTVYGNCVDGKSTCGGIYGFQGSGSLSEFNHVYDNGPAVRTGQMSGGGIWFDTQDGVLPDIIRYNLVEGNVFGLMAEMSDDAQIYGNIVLDCVDDDLYYQYGTGILVHSWDTDGIDGTQVYNNTLNNNRVGIKVEGDGSTAANCTNNIIKNNIIANSIDRALVAKDGGENDGVYGSGNVYLNNCFDTESSNFIEWGDGTYKSTYDTWESAYGRSTDSIEADPIFTNVSSDDFTLAVTSPAINTGVDLGLSFRLGLNPTSSWTSDVKTINQNFYNEWEIGGYVFPIKKARSPWGTTYAPWGTGF
jgi:hypothetical protein